MLAWQLAQRRSSHRTVGDPLQMSPLRRGGHVPAQLWERNVVQVPDWLRRGWLSRGLLSFSAWSLPPRHATRLRNAPSATHVHLQRLLLEARAAASARGHRAERARGPPRSQVARSSWFCYQRQPATARVPHAILLQSDNEGEVGSLKFRMYERTEGSGKVNTCNLSWP